MVNLILRSAATDVMDFEEGKLSVIGLRLDKDAPVIRKSILEIAKETDTFDFRVVALHRNFRTIIPKGNDRFLPNDQVFVIVKPESNSVVLKLAGKEEIKFDNIMILGGSKIGKKSGAC
jgi:trk system potassium uptake protein TrkA